MKQGLDHLITWKAGDCLIATFKIANKLHLVRHLIVAYLTSVLIPSFDRYKRSLPHINEDKPVFQ